MEWPDFARGFEPWGLDLRMRGCVCVEFVRRLCGVVSNSGLFVGSMGRTLNQFCWNTMFATTMHQQEDDNNKRRRHKSQILRGP